MSVLADSPNDAVAPSPACSSRARVDPTGKPNGSSSGISMKS
jgi:hypothetical protein